MTIKKDAIGGTVNSVRYHSDLGLVEKGYQNGNGITSPQDLRKRAESYSLKNIPIAPEFVGDGDGVGIIMRMLEGESQLDLCVKNISEGKRDAVWHEAGNALRVIHDQFKSDLYPPFNKDVLLKSSSGKLQKISAGLIRNGVNTIEIVEYLERNFERVSREVKKTGTVWTHGDYWLNNLLGSFSGSDFKVSGVIDWELASTNSPYVDFAVAYMSIIRQHPGSEKEFWKGYGRKPDFATVQYFSILKMIEWMYSDDSDYSSSFYSDKFKLLKEELARR